MSLLSLNDFAMLARLTRDIPRFLRTPVTAAQAVRAMQRQLGTREKRFLQVVEQTIYSHPQSPYLRLLRSAGCTLGDLKGLLAKEGLEGTLSRLVEAGVYVTFDEFKGQKEAVRGSQRYPFAEKDFDNPRPFPHFEVKSGGTRSHGTSVKISLPFLTDLARNTALALEAHGLAEHHHAIWLVAGLSPTLVYAKLGRPPIAWFYTLRSFSFKLRIGSRYLAILGGLSGRPLPTPTFIGLQDPGGLADWLGNRVKEGVSVCVTTYASSAVRICLAAKEKGIPLPGVCFITLGEPFTETKQRAIEAVGAFGLVRYAFTEGGILGYGCVNPRVPDDLHFFSNSYGLIQRSREMGDSGLWVDAFSVTCLFPAAPKVLLNVESGDYGIVERRGCGCRLGGWGLTTHLARIRSFEKLSAEGMTFIQVNLLRVLEEVLPACFGGTSADYQLLEEERENGIPRLFLIVSPEVALTDEESVRRTFIEELRRNGGFERAETWRRAGTVEIKRQWPIATKAGKILPLHLIKR